MSNQLVGFSSQYGFISDALVLRDLLTPPVKHVELPKIVD